MAEKGSEESHELECDRCRLHRKFRVADKYCPQCDELLCHMCVQGHESNARLKDHPLQDRLTVSFSRDSTHPLMFCGTHKRKQISFHCDRHGVLCCETCRILTHGKCELKSITTKAEEIQQHSLLKDKLEIVSDLKLKLKHMKVSRKRRLDLLGENKANTLSDLRDLKKEVDEMILKMEKDIIDDINITEKGIRTKIESQISEVETILKRLDELHSILQDCESSLDNKLMCIGIIKSEQEIMDIEKLVDEKRDSKWDAMIFEPNSEVADLMATLKTLGKLVVESNCDIMEASVSSQKSMSVKTDWISGSTFLENGELVLCDVSNHQLRVYKPDLTPKEKLKLPGFPYDVAAISQRSLVVTLNYQGPGRLQYVDVRPRLTTQRTITLGEHCRGVTYSAGKILVIVRVGKVQCGIFVLDTDGSVQNKIPLLLGDPRYLAVDRSGRKIWINNYNGLVPDFLLCLDMAGTQLFGYKSDDLVGPGKMFLDDQNNLVVCGCASNNIQVIMADGKYSRLLLTDADGLKWPETISFRPQDRTLVVGMRENSPSCRVFTLD